MRITDKELTIASISISCIGIILLLIISTQIPSSTIAEIESKEDGSHVRINTTITKTNIYKNQTFLTLTDTCTLTGIIAEPVTIPAGTKATITGKISTYKGKKEIIIERIELIK
jgi:DNA/RNA endonuclease YhcR with UshA esterase domain